jgi:hypothetical protein
MPTKPWYQSKTIWSDVATVLMGALPLIDKQFGTHIASSPLYAGALALLGSLGIYGRSTSTTTISGS